MNQTGEEDVLKILRDDLVKLQTHKEELNTFKTDTLSIKEGKWFNAPGTDNSNRLNLLKIINNQREQRTKENLTQYFDCKVIVYEKKGNIDPPYSQQLNFSCCATDENGITTPDKEMKFNSNNPKMIYWIDHVLIKCIESGINNIKKRISDKENIMKKRRGKGETRGTRERSRKKEQQI